MNRKPERGQAKVAIALLLAIIVLAWLFISMAANQRGMQAGADAIGEAAGKAIDNLTYDQEAENIIWQIEQGPAVEFWLNEQKLYPNKYAANKRPIESWAATNCYNNHGFFQLWEVRSDDQMNFDLHGLCQESDKKIYDIILRRRGTSNEYDFINAFMPKKERGNLLRDIIYWLKGKPGARAVNPPSDITIFIDGIAP
jgi:ABC-type cobalt transport system substrate-binding protein